MADVEYNSNTDKVLAAITGGAMDGLIVAAEFLLTESRKEVPHEEGTLELSGAVSQDRDAMTVAVSYDTEYAVRQHEELTWQHAPDRKAKYLEDPALMHRSTMARIIAKQARRAVGT